MNVFREMWAYLTTGDHWTGDGGMLDLLGEQLLLTVTALLLAVVVGIPLACWLGHLGRGGFLAAGVSNVGRAVPILALLALLVRAEWPGTAYLGPYGRAGLATLVALALFALPPLITQTYVAVRGSPPTPRRRRSGWGCRAGSCSGGSSCRWRCRSW
ncbi:hypothetical protein [Nocardioides sp. TF02-7]|uniref:hypothetical protein n=1 Tax=Nocardioides sp. TF02-7 TaxID=2917724 RepID=UPI001F052407|nr:hypothetical protein [Nocardioides sp. TF02-7]UMG93895.1 hypothetical protein MF408_07215 [Nocardioides sp. TF02-7]